NEYVVDRVETTSMVWMGLTMGCARCHDHKYDPVRQSEFYSFYAFFNSIGEKGLDGRYGNAEPLLPLPAPGQKDRQDQLRIEIAALEKDLPEAGVAAAQSDWEKSGAAALPVPPADGLVAHYEMDGHLADTSGGYRHGRVVRGEVTYGEGQISQSMTLSGETRVVFGDTAAFESGRPFTLALWLRPGATRAMDVLQQVDAAAGRRGWELALDESVHIGDLKRGVHLQFHLIHRWPGSVLRLRTRERVLQSEWRHVAIVSNASGLRLFVDGKARDFEIVENTLAGTVETRAPLETGNKEIGRPYKGQLDDLRVYQRALDAAEIETLAIHYPIRTVAAEAKRSRPQRDRLRDYFLTYAAPEPMRRIHASLSALKTERERLEKEIPTSMVMTEAEKPRDTFVLGRGDYRNRGDKVSPGVPAVLPPLAEDLPRNRLGLARWLVDPAHPLTARVAVNRYWQMYFGTGLVKTAEDFGLQGESPSHPELLDWLAAEFVRGGWDVRAMQRLIVTSATYRQLSRVTPELLERDPENRLLARGARFRLPAESVRDNALAISGLLVEKVGGPSVFPYQPKGLWEEIAYGDVYSAQTYSPGAGPDLYRRSLYTFWKRTSPPPSMLVFDAPDREKCTARRLRTNTPLQALALLNDPTFVEAARALAQRMMAAGRDPGDRVTTGFRLAAARPPAPKERQLLRDLAERQLAEYRRAPGEANTLLAVGESRAGAGLDTAELAAWTTVASVILNLDEVITRE
ncbi:MAG: DUF1553 domain-containing protein, partial [Bryobacteraceae bacterium]